MNTNAATSGLMVVDRVRDVNEVPNLVKALSCAGSCAGLYLGLQVKPERSNTHELSVLGVNAAVGGGAGFLFGYALHYSLLTIVDGVRMISIGIKSFFSDAPSNRAQSPLVPSKPASKS